MANTSKQVFDDRAENQVLAYRMGRIAGRAGVKALRLARQPTATRIKPHEVGSEESDVEPTDLKSAL